MDSDSDSPFNYSWPSLPKMRIRRRGTKQGRKSCLLLNPCSLIVLPPFHCLLADHVQVDVKSLLEWTDFSSFLHPHWNLPFWNQRHSVCLVRENSFIQITCCDFPSCLYFFICPVNFSSGYKSSLTEQFWHTKDLQNSIATTVINRFSVCIRPA